MNTMNPFRQFSASKMSENPRFNVSVEYTDFMGNVHRIQCKGFGTIVKFIIIK